MAVLTATSTLMAVATSSGKRFSAPPFRGRASSLPHLPPRPPSCSPSNKRFFFSELTLSRDSTQLQPTMIKASSSEETSSTLEVEEVFTDLKEQWDAIEDKSSLLVYGTGAVVAVWLSSVFVDAINSVPLVPTLMELVGLGFTGWFIYRYLLFKSTRKELASEIEALKSKITGSD
ncbi:protein CURVATURE THYLAKOID 1A, chloroplastic-like [Punica granatum]|uniref:Protein CURVATURE THYLAKOID 1A, chloroplastic-like n=2 Tax=Punica granatum TaxID=22663 RepID=A0A6P8CEJ9_PUNGR|nr:protein CURVATURE THYLAKOID 1A, chloroplastic-like [Punica granatum]XP_031380874.1 protein CURVATURE THYLAKOID 1A, chloroplastic-like [Punica granatum]OWM75581.1 hypothetical protein CDL15_Pgr021745 [Punica granatum]PKI52105.1 hypothetical protein CRG98_027521 [Punica granatum]